MKKIFLVSFFFLLSFSSAQAGLFEYHMNGTLDSYVQNASKDPDVIEQIPSSSTYSYSTYPNYYSSQKQTTIFANDYYKGGYNYTTSYNYYRSNGSYRSSDYENMLRDELRRFENEQDFIDERKTEIEQELRNISRYDWEYYDDLREDLEEEYDYLEEREEELFDIIDDIENDLEMYEDDGDIHYDFYYNEYGQRIYFDNEYNQNRDYYYNTQYYSCSRSSMHYDDCYYDAYYYDDYYYNRYLKNDWVNPNLKPVQDGHIYIK